ncbi:MAG: transcription antitermination factor NusB [Microcystaceae cyanobacterium]
MPSRQQPRRLSRELTLLSLSQIKGAEEQLDQKNLNELVIAAIRTLTGEAHETLEVAASEVSKGNEWLSKGEIKTYKGEPVAEMVKEALELTKNAINRLGTALELPEMIQMASQHEVRSYALELIATVHRRRNEIDDQLNKVMVDWTVKRIPRIDQDILRMAVAEMTFLNIPYKVAINEAVELAKRYSDDDGYRFINGVLRKVSDQLNQKQTTVRS